MSRDLVRFHVLRNALYHTSRRLTFDRWNRWCSFLIILLGAASFSDLWRWADQPWMQPTTGLLTAVFGSIQLVFDFSGKARDHQALQRDYYNLMAEIEEHPAASEDQVAAWNAKMTRIAADEPPILRALDAKAYNDALSGTGFNTEDHRLVIPWHQRILGQFWAYEGYQYKKVGEVQPNT